MYYRFISEPRENGESLYSTEWRMSDSGPWLYVSGSCSRHKEEAEKWYESIKAAGVIAGKTVLREDTVDAESHV
jgi:hypothetical protein